MARAYAQLGRPLLFGHRGSRSGLLENTLEAIERGIEGGAHGIEIDVRPCASGEIVVAHDATLARITDERDPRSIAACPWSELRRVRLTGGLRLPILGEVIELCAARSVLLNVEVKRDVPSRALATRAIAACLRHAPGSVVVSSFDPAMLAGLALLAPNVERALLLEPRHRRLSRVAPLLRASAIHPAAELVNARRIRAWQRRGLFVVPWTVNDFGEAQRLLSLGVDGLISDFPARLVPLFA